MMELLVEGLKIAALGIGFVFFFLLLLILCTSLMSFLIARLFPHTRIAPVSPQAASSPSLTGSAASIDPLTLTVITAAIHQHRTATRQRS